MTGTASFFHALAPALVADVLMVLLVYCFATINRREQNGGEAQLSHLWLIVMVFAFVLYGLYTWGVYPLRK